MDSVDEARPSASPVLPAVAWRPVLAAMVALAALLTATSARYGYHRDELYFRMLKPAWGYVDQPPFAPWLARLTMHLADQPWAMRLPATIATVGSVLVLVLITRELQGGRTAQAVCAWGYAFASLPLIMGHALLTSTLDLPVWPAIMLCAVRAILRREPRWWLVAGLIVGLSTYNKLLVAVLVAALVVAVALIGPRDLLRSRWVGAGAVAALVLAAPNLIYQATHGWPQFAVGRALAADNAADVHAKLVPFLFLILGPPLVPIWIAGLAALARRPQWRELRFVAVAFPLVLVATYVMGAQFYYPFGLLAVIFAVGCVPTERWMQGRKRAVVIAGVALNAVVSIALGLPVIPLSALGATRVPSINQVAADSVGWPRYVADIAEVYDALPADVQAHAAILTSNYGEAGAVTRYGSADALPAVYSGHNALFDNAKPPASVTVVVFVGGQVRRAASLFDSCVTSAHRLDNGVDVDNEEQGEPIAVCTGPRGGWDAVWPALRHDG